MKIHYVLLPIPADLYSFITDMASDRAHYKGYTTDDMIENQPQKDQILKWLKEIQENKMRYKR